LKVQDRRISQREIPDFFNRIKEGGTGDLLEDSLNRDIYRIIYILSYLKKVISTNVTL
jgi:hypothetical protein